MEVAVAVAVAAMASRRHSHSQAIEWARAHPSDPAAVCQPYKP